MVGTGDWASPGPLLPAESGAPPSTGAVASSIPATLTEAPLLPPPNFSPGIIPLRPLGVGEILDGSFAAVRRHPGPMFLLSVLIAGLGGAIASIVTLNAVANTSNGNQGTAALGALSATLNQTFQPTVIAASVLNRFLAGILTGLVVLIVSDAVMGRPATLASTWTRVRPRFPTLCAVSAISAIVVTAGFLVLAIPGIFLGTVWVFTSAVVVLEGCGVRAAFRRSWQLAIGAFWRLLGVRTLSAVIVSVVALLLSLPFLIAFGVTALGHLSATDGGQAGTLATVLITIGQALAATVTAPIASGIAALLYIDRRIRAEALDVSLAAAVRADVSAAQRAGAG